MEHKLYVVGGGPGDVLQLTAAASGILKNAGCIVVSRRCLPIIKESKRIITLEDFPGTLNSIEKELQKGSVAVVVSGDPGIYSLMPVIKKRFPEKDITVVPGISSLQFLCAAVAETWNDTVILSGHGRSIKESKVLDTVDQNRSTAFFCGPDRSPAWLCSILSDNGLDDTEVIVGELLGCGGEKITRGAPSVLRKIKFDPLSVILVLNSAPWTIKYACPGDEEFTRTDIPMTKMHIRSAIINILQLRSDSVMWDIGAGTGSVSVASAMLCRNGEVHMIERNPRAVELEKINVKKFHLHNVVIHEQSAMEAIMSLPVPSHVFIGGSGDELQDILKAITKIGSGIRIVVSAVTLKTLSVAAPFLSGEKCCGFDIVQISINGLKDIGGNKIIAAQNPVTVMSVVTL